MNLKKTLKRIMKDKGTNANKLSEKMGVSKQRAYQILNQNSVKIETLKKIADVLGVTVDYILQIDQEEETK